MKKNMIFVLGATATCLTGIGVGTSLEHLGANTVLLSGIVSCVGMFGFLMTDRVAYRLKCGRHAKN